MIAPLNAWQKLIAYGSLLAVLACTAIGLAIIWLTITH